MFGSVVTISLVFLTGLVSAGAELISSDRITLEDLTAYCHEATNSNNSGSRSVKNSTWKLEDDSSGETEYDKLQRRQAELCRQGKIGAPGQLQESCSMWRFKYIDEQQASGFEVKIVEESLDSRLANVIYTTLSTKAMVPDFFKVTGEDFREMEQNFRSLEGPQVDAEQCTWQLEQMVGQLDELEARLELKRQNASFRLGLDERHIRLALAMDSFGRYEAGLLQGKFLSMGSYKECQSGRLLLPTHRTTSSELARADDEELVKTRFCWALMDLSEHRSASLKARQTDSFEASQHLFQLGVCLPQSCHTRSFLKPQASGSDGATLSKGQQVDRNRELVQRLVDSQFKLPSSLFIDESLPLHSVYCLADKQSAYKVPTSGQLVLAFLGLWLLLAVYATYYQEIRGKRHASNRKKNDDVDDEKQAIGAIGLIEGNFVDKHKWAQEVVDCMNLKKSWQDFVGEDYDQGMVSTDSDVPQQPARFGRPDSRVNLATLNPIKVFGCMYVVLGHAFIIVTVFSADSLSTFNQLEKDPIALSLITGTLIVDTFFVITGLIMGYVAMSKSGARLASVEQEASESESVTELGAKSSESTTGTKPMEARQWLHSVKPKWVVAVFVKHWLHNVLSRYLRLVPLFFLTYWFKRSVLVYYMSFDKPYADNGFNKDTYLGACKHESWWTPVNMMPAFLPLAQQCMLQCWSIATDLFFALTVTPILLIMTKRPKLALLLGSTLCLASWMWSVKLHLSMPAHREVEIVHWRGHGFSILFGSMSYLYTYPHLRFSSILVGVLAGYMIHVYDTNKHFEWPQWMRGWATKLSFGLILGGVFVFVNCIHELKSLAAGYERYLFAYLHPSGRACWVLVNGILLARMATDWRNSYLMRQSANKFWAIIARLNLAILLVHVDVLIYHTSGALVTDYFSYRNMIALFSAAYVICIPLALFMHIVYENPIYKLTKRHVLSLV